jgi:hypothetical protein
MPTLRLHDPGRRPANWTEIIGAGQFAAIARDLDAGTVCDLDGRPFADSAVATCAVFDSFPEARAACEAAVLSAPGIQIDIFDAHGRANAPLLSVVHPDRAAEGEGNARAVLKRRIIAWVLIAASVPALVLAYVIGGAHSVLPGFLGLNLLLIGGRLLWFNLALRETERARHERLKSVDGP